MTHSASLVNLAALGAGSRLATAITQAYFRICDYHPLTILVADALCLVFGGGGASVAQLVDYLGVAEKKVSLALEAIPAEMRCTSSDVEAQQRSLLDGYDEEEDLRALAERKKAEKIFYLNYKQLLPFAYAHVSRMLLPLCVMSLPPSTSSASNGSSGGGESAPPQGSSGVLMSLRLQQQQDDCREGIRCPSCQMYHDVSEFYRSTSTLPFSSSGAVLPCPACGADVLQQMLAAIQAYYHDRTAEGLPLLVAPLSSAQRASGLTASPAASRPTLPASPPLPPAALNCPLARDPLLVQQSRVFFQLYRTKFACMNDDLYVVQVEDILTEPEFERRRELGASGCAVSVSERFRAAHRSANGVHVKVESYSDIGKRKREENREKMAKRSHIPPWMRARGLVMPAARDAKKSRSTPTKSNNTSESHSCLKTAEFILREFVDDDFDEVALPFVQVRQRE